MYYFGIDCALNKSGAAVVSSQGDILSHKLVVVKPTLSRGEKLLAIQGIMTEFYESTLRQHGSEVVYIAEAPLQFGHIRAALGIETGRTVFELTFLNVYRQMFPHLSHPSVVYYTPNVVKATFAKNKRGAKKPDVILGIKERFPQHQEATYSEDIWDALALVLHHITGEK